jgi:Fanconi-associated nuclease 1
MLGQTIPHPKSTNFFEDGESSQRQHKRLKKGHSSTFPRANKQSIPDSDVESGEEDLVHDSSAKSGLEATLPDIRTDQEAIDQYEAQRTASQTERDAREGRFRNQNWTKGMSSIYVDAFNLALETVLDEENHLFDDAEKALFGYWRKLGYEAQYLSVSHTTVNEYLLIVKQLCPLIPT